VNETPPVKLMDKDYFFTVVKAAFGQRRKTLVNALHNFKALGKSKEEIKEILKKLGIDEMPGEKHCQLRSLQSFQICFSGLHK